MRFDWSSVSTVAPKAGVYAWYYSPVLSMHDVNSIIARVEDSKRIGDGQAAGHISDFLDKHVYRRFAESPYSVRISGALKATFAGTANHEPTQSDSLLQRLCENPERLLVIREVLRSSAPELSCPLYIGMAKNLQNRLAGHQRLIEQYRVRELNMQLTDEMISKNEERDHSFASEVAVRGIPPSQLFVCVNYIESADHNYVDVENILNRIFFPIFGRN